MAKNQREYSDCLPFERFVVIFPVILIAIELGFAYSLGTVNLATIYTNDVSMKVYYIMALFFMTCSVVALLMMSLFSMDCARSCVGDSVPSNLVNFIIGNVLNVLGFLAVAVILIKYDMNHGLPNEASTDADKLMRLALFAPSQIISIITVSLFTAFGLAQIPNITSPVQLSIKK
jgi:hypothetical protein